MLDYPQYDEIDGTEHFDCTATSNAEDKTLGNPMMPIIGLDDSFWMSLFDNEIVTFKVAFKNDELLSVRRIRVIFKFPPEDFKIVVHKP